MRIVSLSLVWLFACSSPQSSPPTITPSGPPGGSAEPQPEGSATPPPATAMSPEDCKAQGGTVKNDIGNGSVKCEDTEKELGKVRFGMEGGVCCAPR